MKERMIHLESLQVKDAYKGNIIEHASVELFEQEMVGIVGESGSGKTMTVRAILDSLPDELDVKFTKNELLGKDISKLTQKEQRKLIGCGVGFVPQNTTVFLHPLIKIKHQIGEAFIINRLGNKKEAREKAVQLLEKVGIRDAKRVLNSYPVQLSGGMKQRVHIAMALMTNPKLIIADEPTTALDTIIQKQVMELLERLHVNEGVSILFISHDLTMIKRFCDRVYVMYQGKVVETGETSQLFSNPEHTHTQKLISLLPTITKEKQMAKTV